MIGMHCDTLNAVNKHEKSSTASNKWLLLLIPVYINTDFYTHLCCKRWFFITIANGIPYDRTLMMRRYRHRHHRRCHCCSDVAIDDTFLNRQNFASNSQHRDSERWREREKWMHATTLSYIDYIWHVKVCFSWVAWLSLSLSALLFPQLPLVWENQYTSFFMCNIRQKTGFIPAFIC